MLVQRSNSGLAGLPALITTVTALLLSTALICDAARFSVLHSMIGDIPVIQLYDNLLGQSAEVLPTQGGRVESIKLKSPVTHQVRDIILTHGGNASAIKENAIFKGALLLPFANRIANGQYTFQGKPYQLHLNEPERHNAIHGLLYDKELEVAYTHGDDQNAIATLVYRFNGSAAGYPFPLEVDVTYVLHSDAFIVSIGATNQDSTRPLPFYMGWHPYIKVADTSKAILQFDGCTNYSLVDVDKTTLIPTGTTEATKLFTNLQPIGGTHTAPTYIDDGFAALTPPAPDRNCTALTHTVYDPVTKEAVFLFQEAQFRFSQVFTGSASITGEQAIAVEPMSAETDAYNNHIGLSILNAGQRWQGSFGISLGPAGVSRLHNHHGQN